MFSDVSGSVIEIDIMVDPERAEGKDGTCRYRCTQVDHCDLRQRVS